MADPRREGDPIWRTVGFLVGLPFLSACYSTLTSWKLIDMLGVPLAFGYFFGHALLPWLLTALLTWGWMGLLARWRPQPLTLAAIGGCTANLLVLPFATSFAHLLPSSAQAISGASAEGVTGTLAAFLRAFVLWMAANYLSDRYLGFRPFRYRDGEDGVAAVPGTVQDAAAAFRAGPLAPAGQLPFLGRLARPATPTQLLALKAEQHYIKVITTIGSELVLYRLSDAVRDLPGELGLQVHRSWWVSRQAIAEVRDEGGRKLTLVLTNGLDVPVSSPYQAMTRRWLGTAPGDQPFSSAQEQVVEDRPGQ